MWYVRYADVRGSVCVWFVECVCKSVCGCMCLCGVFFVFVYGVCENVCNCLVFCVCVCIFEPCESMYACK